MYELWPTVWSLWDIKPQFSRYTSDVIPISLSTQSWGLSVFALWRFCFYFFLKLYLLVYLLCQVLAAACGIQFPDEGLNQAPCLRKERKEKKKVKSPSHVRLLATPWPIAHQAPLSMEFSRQEYWSGLPFPSPGDLPDPGIKPWSLTLQADSLLSEPPGKSRALGPWNQGIPYFYFFNQDFSGISVCSEWEYRVLASFQFSIWTRSLHRWSLDLNC